MSKSTKGTRAKHTAPQKFDFLHRLMADKTLSFSAKAIATELLLTFHNANTGRCNPSIAAIAKSTGCSRRTAFSAITELKKAGWITVESTHGGSSSDTNKYTFDFGRVKSTAPPTGAKNAPHTGAKSARVQDLSSGVQTSAHEPLRTTPPSEEGVGGPFRRAPDGAPEGEEEDQSTLEPQFEQLCRLWVKPDGINRAKSWKAFRAVCEDHDSDDVLASAGMWVARVESRYLPKLELWLENGAWQYQPPNRQRNGQHKPSAAEVAAGLAAASRDDDGEWS